MTPILCELIPLDSVLGLAGLWLCILSSNIHLAITDG